MKKVCHLTSAHPRYDTRIFVKECQSLAKEYQVSLIVADSKGNETKDGIAIYDVGKSRGRLNRFFKSTYRVYKKALALDSDIYHFHDPELLWVGLKLQRAGKRVIYDAHEDIELQVLSKEYLSFSVRKVLSVVLRYFQAYCMRRFSAVVCATSFIQNKFEKDSKRAIAVNNFPVIRELESQMAWSERQDKICYIGALSEVRGIKELVCALDYLEDVELDLAGTFFNTAFEKEVKSLNSWKRVNYLGFVGRNEIKKILESSKIGIVTLHPIVNYQDALPVKMFEYMLAGIPVVASDIALWKSIVDEAECGVCVDPYNPKEIAQAIQKLMDNQELASQMGENGKRAVVEKYNWAKEEEKLLQCYRDVLR